MSETRVSSEENTNSCPREAGGLRNAPTVVAAGRGHAAQTEKQKSTGTMWTVRRLQPNSLLVCATNK